jgi:hypothetical protein
MLVFTPAMSNLKPSGFTVFSAVANKLDNDNVNNTVNKNITVFFISFPFQYD